MSLGKCYCCVHENGHCRLVRVDDSTICSEIEHRLAGTGGRLNCSGTLDVTGAHFSWALDCWEAQFGLGF